VRIRDKVGLALYDSSTVKAEKGAARAERSREVKIESSRHGQLGAMRDVLQCNKCPVDAGAYSFDFSAPNEPAKTRARVFFFQIYVRFDRRKVQIVTIVYDQFVGCLLEPT
jgi:hypothetical protein